jgi:hypothetical protein
VKAAKIFVVTKRKKITKGHRIDENHQVSISYH